MIGKGGENCKKKEERKIKANWQRALLTFTVHHLLHNVLLALVKWELAREVEAFFALYFDWLLMMMMMMRGVDEGSGGGRGGAGR